ncbi:HD-GYP domain-containing protein [Leeia sp.]|uniref:HD-GYP domain-containing protein n=1 Tax=Leeia sp. TaxID=2884678 RepID=UPI0035B36373
MSDTQHRPTPSGLLRSLLLMAWMVEARDPYTGGHLWRVARLSEVLAEAAGLPEREVQRIALAAFLHDMGKIGVPDAILRKPGKLDDEEYLAIKQHPDIGLRLLQPHPLASLALSVVYHHHEMPDGKGYPMGLSGQNIPLDARLVGICDAFDAMTSHRPYRQGMPVERALAIIEGALGQQFDAELGALFVALGRQGRFADIVGYSDEGIPLAHCVDCGPVLQRYRSTQSGDHSWCPACQAGYRWQQTATGLMATPDGSHRSNGVTQAEDALLMDHLEERWSVLL